MKVDAYGKHAGSIVFDDRPSVVMLEVGPPPALPDHDRDASAASSPCGGELTALEALNLIDRVARRNTPVLVIGGQRSLARPDLLALVQHARRRRLRVGLAPRPLTALTPDTIEALQHAGVDQLILPLDAPVADEHDRYSGEPGAFVRTLESIGYANDCRLPVQLTTRFGARNHHHRERLAELVEELGVAAWEASFMLPHGRDGSPAALAPHQFRDVFESLYRLDSETEALVTLREAPHFRRFILEKEGYDAEFATLDRDLRLCAERSAHLVRGAGLSPSAGDTGRGCLFVDRLGYIYPSASLPIRAGNVRTDTIAGVYRHSSLFTDLRAHASLKGKCGRCELRQVCGGSRARAYAARGDYLAPDPACDYSPRAEPGHGQSPGTGHGS